MRHSTGDTTKRAARASSRGGPLFGAAATAVTVVVVAGLSAGRVWSDPNRGASASQIPITVSGIASPAAPGDPGGPGGMPPDGPPPDGPGGPGGPGGPPPGGNRAYKLGGVYTLSDGSSKTLTGKKISSTKTDVSAVYVSGGSSLTLVSPTITTSGNTSSNDNSSFHGLNAAVLATDRSKVVITGGSIATSGTGANGLFAAGSGASVTMTGGKVIATGSGGHGVMATKGGSITLNNVDITTAEERGAPIATDRGSGTIVVNGGIIRSAGKGSPAIYSTGRITVSGADMVSTGAEGAVIEGANSIVLKNCRLTGQKLDGVMIYQSFSGDAEGQNGSFAMSGGSLTATTGPLFYITNTNAVINLEGVKLSNPSGLLVKAAAGRWGRTGSNGGKAVLTASNETLTGDLTADAWSTVSARLKRNTVLTGAATNAALAIDETSKWVVTANSALTSLTVAGPVPGNTIECIIGNGHAVTYDPTLAANKWLGGRTYNLAGGGTLAPR